MHTRRRFRCKNWFTLAGKTRTRADCCSVRLPRPDKGIVYTMGYNWGVGWVSSFGQVVARWPKPFPGGIIICGRTAQHRRWALSQLPILMFGNHGLHGLVSCLGSGLNGCVFFAEPQHPHSTLGCWCLVRADNSPVARDNNGCNCNININWHTQKCTDPWQTLAAAWLAPREGSGRDECGPPRIWQKPFPSTTTRSCVEESLTCTDAHGRVTRRSFHAPCVLWCCCCCTSKAFQRRCS